MASTQAPMFFWTGEMFVNIDSVHSAQILPAWPKVGKPARVRVEFRTINRDPIELDLDSYHTRAFLNAIGDGHVFDDETIAEILADLSAAPIAPKPHRDAAGGPIAPAPPPPAPTHVSYVYASPEGTFLTVGLSGVETTTDLNEALHFDDALEAHRWSEKGEGSHEFALCRVERRVTPIEPVAPGEEDR